jgi:spermidine synthase
MTTPLSRWLVFTRPVVAGFHLAGDSGGDGFVAQAVLDRNPAARVEIVDIDAAVVATAKQWFAQTVFSDARVTLHVGDAQDYLGVVPSGTIDVVLIDLTDNPPCGEFDPQPWAAFYERLLAGASRVLLPGGSVAVQAGAANAAAGRFDSARGLRLAVATTFCDVSESAVLIPSFGEACLFLTGWKHLRKRPSSG